MQRVPLRLAGRALPHATAAAQQQLQGWRPWGLPDAPAAAAGPGPLPCPHQGWPQPQPQLQQPGRRWHASAANPSSEDPQTQQQQPQQQQQQRPTQQQQQRAGAAARQPPRLVVYKGRWITWVRYAVRMKVGQLVGAAGVVVALAGLGADDVSLVDAAVLFAIAAGSVGGSLSLWYYGRRYVGELSLLEPRRDVARFSVLDMWGNREDVDVPLAAVQPPLRNMPAKVANLVVNQLLFPVNCDVPGQGRRQFYVSVVAGQLVEGKVFIDLMKGEYVPPPAPSSSRTGGDASGSGAGTP